MGPTFTENPGNEKKFTEIPGFYQQLNQCWECGVFPGKYTHKITQKIVGVYLRNDSRGGKICNLCVDKGLGFFERKLNKKEKKKMKKMRREMVAAQNIPHITIDAKGNTV